MVTFEQARQLVDDELRPTWPEDLGDLVVSPDGLADATHFAVFHHGTAADPGPVPGPGGLVAWVDRATGEVEWWPLWDHFPRLDRMEPVGAGADVRRPEHCTADDRDRLPREGDGP